MNCDIVLYTVCAKLHLFPLKCVKMFCFLLDLMARSWTNETTNKLTNYSISVDILLTYCK